MNNHTKTQIRLQNELAELAACRAMLRDLYIENQSPHLLSAMDFVLERMKLVEQQLDAVIEAQTLNEIVPVISLASKPKFRI